MHSWWCEYDGIFDKSKWTWGMAEMDLHLVFGCYICQHYNDVGDLCSYCLAHKWNFRCFTLISPTDTYVSRNTSICFSFFSFHQKCSIWVLQTFAYFTWSKSLSTELYFLHLNFFVPVCHGIKLHFLDILPKFSYPLLWFCPI